MPKLSEGQVQLPLKQLLSFPTFAQGERALAVVKAKKKLSTGCGKSKTSERYSVNDLMQKVDDCIDSFQLELACKFCDKALQIDPDSVRVLDTLGPLLLETGDMERAIDISSQSLIPNVLPFKYLLVLHNSQP